MIRLLRIAVVAPVLAACACSASYPTVPSEPTPVTMQILVNRPLGAAVADSAYSFSAYALRSDFAWEDVTAAAEWRSSSTAVLRPFNVDGTFMATGPGSASVLVRHEGLAASFDVTVLAAPPLHRPRLSVSVLPDPRVVGGSGSAAATLSPLSGSSVTVTADAIWESSDPSVVTVDRGRLVGVGPGTATITASYQGLSDSVRVSVAPPSR
jgi:hypothetical protein